VDNRAVPNDHYVSRFQIKQWLPKSQPRVLIYDCQADRLEPVHPKRLFAFEDLNEPEVEARLNQLIESPLTQGRAELIDSTSNTTRSWRVWRAAWLLMLLQHARTGDALKLRGHTPLREILSWPEEKLDALVFTAQKTHNLVRYHHSADCLFLPSSGHYAVPMRDEGCATMMSFAIAHPISPRTILLRTSKTARDNPDDIFSLARTTPLCCFGSGPHVGKLVVPPRILGDNARRADLVDRIREVRAAATRHWECIKEIRLEYFAGFERAGIQLELIPGGGPARYQPRKG
jgi:hypothetical protein